MPNCTDIKGVLDNEFFDFGIHWKVTYTDIILAPSLVGEVAKNLLIWRKQDIQEYAKQYECTKVGPKEEKEIRYYFEHSYQWERAMHLALDPRVSHLHAGVETSVSPDTLFNFAKENLESRGWKIDFTGQEFIKIERGEVVELKIGASFPECVFDLCIVYNPEVILKTAVVDPPLLEEARSISIREPGSLEFWYNDTLA